VSWWDRLVADFFGYLLAAGISAGAVTVVGVVIYDLGFYRGWNVRGRAEVQAAVERATAESVPVLVPAQRAGEQ
jgi:hypothetical protein